MQTHTEGTTTFVTDSEEKITKKMPVFYNPVMQLNRDLSLIVLATMKEPKIGLPMEASGVRAARIMHELVEPKRLRIKELLVNDISPAAIRIAKKNVKATFSVMDASVFMRTNRPFDYIDIDPFGTPNAFLDAATQSLAKDGILAVTATDTAALAGTYPHATKRKYWATPSRTWVMHEIGLRILIRKVQLIAAQYDKALIPILSVSSDHYYRIFFRCEKGVNKVKNVLKKHGSVHVDSKTMDITENGDVGPLWTGPLHSAKQITLFHKTVKLFPYMIRAQKLLDIIKDECRMDTVGFLCQHELASKYKLPGMKRDVLMQKLGKHARRTHISPTGFKTDLPVKKIVKLLR